MALAPLLAKLSSPQMLSMFWAGTSFAIDVEAVVKFKAPTLKREQGFDVGRHVFAAQSHVETVLAMATAAAAYQNPDTYNQLALGIGAGAHLVQKAVLMPILNDRAVRIIKGEQVEKSPVHFIYLGVEFVKLAALLAV